MADELLPGISVHFMVLDPPLDRMALLVEYLKPYVNEFVIVDTGSSESDIAVMQSWGSEDKPVRILHETFVNFSETRNKGLAVHKHFWTLGLDPDELPSPMMMSHIVWAISPEGREAAHAAQGWAYWTKNYWGGVYGPEMPYHWHCRLWRTQWGKLYKPVHELVELSGMPEETTRGTSILPNAPKAAYLIHSKAQEEISRADALYGAMGEESR